MKRLLLITALALALASSSCGALFQRHEVVTPTASTNALGVVTITLDTNVYYLVNPGVTNALAKGEELAGRAPFPYGTIAAGVLAVVSSVLGLMVKLKSDKAALVPALIMGIEKAPNNEGTKQMVQTVATAAGVQKRLDQEVQKITR